MKKKILVAMLLAGLTLQAVGCGTEAVPAEPVDEVVEEVEDAELPDIDDETINSIIDEVQNAVDEQTEEAEEEPEAAEDVEDADADFIGHSDANVYENDFFGIGCKLPSNWTYMTDAEIEEANKTTLNLVGDDYEDMLKTAQEAAFIDMMATEEQGYDTINIGIEKLSAINAVAITEEAYAEASKDGLQGALESMGLVVDSCEVVMSEFLGEEHPVVYVDGSYSEVEVHERIIVIKKANYVMDITLARWFDDDCSEMINGFYSF